MRLDELELYEAIRDHVFFIFAENDEEPTQEAVFDFICDRNPCEECEDVLVYCDDGKVCEDCAKDLCEDW